MKRELEYFRGYESQGSRGGGGGGGGECIVIFELSNCKKLRGSGEMNPYI